MNPEEKNENDPAVEQGRNDDAPEAEPQEVAPGERAVFEPEQAGDGQQGEFPEAEEGDGSDEESASEPDKEKRAGRPRADASKLKPILEALIFVAEEPISLDKMAGVLPDCPKKRLKELLAELAQDYAERAGALEIVEVANGYQFRTRAEFAPWLGRLRQQKFARLSRAALETLAIVAYRQPVTRAEAESIRGVDSGAVLGTLLERGLLRILGRKEVPGRPILYGTTQEFLELFGLKNLKDLPTLREIKDMVEASEAAGGSPEGEQAEEGAEETDAAGEEGSAEAGGEVVAASGEDEDDKEEYEEEYEDDDEGDEDEWSQDEEPLGEEEMTTGQLDQILRSTKTRLELYDTDIEEEEETGEAPPAAGEAGPIETVQGEEETKKAGDGDKPDET